MTSDERTRAYGYMLALISGDTEELAQREDDAKLLERMIGLRSGRGDGLAHLSSLNGDIGRLLPRISAEDIGAAVTSASDEEYELVRLLARTTLLWMPMLLTLMRSSLGVKGVAFLDAAQQLFRDPPAEIHIVITTAMLVSLRAKAPSPEEIRRLMAGIEPGMIDAEMFSLIPKTTREEAFKQMEPHQRAHLNDELARSNGGSVGIEGQ
jgi:hypothetical protein